MDDAARERALLARRIRSLFEELESDILPPLWSSVLSVQLTIRQLKVLAVLVSSDAGATGKGLAEAFGVSMASMSGLLDRLVAQGMAERAQDAADGRVTRVQATARGRDALRGLVFSRPEFGDDVLEQLSLADLQALARGVAAIRNVLGERARSGSAAAEERPSRA